MEEGSLPRNGVKRPYVPQENRNLLFALLATGVVALAVSLAPAPAAAGTGGFAIPGQVATTLSKPAQATGGVRFGSRVLREGMVGEDVKVLNAIVRGKTKSKRVRISEVFHAQTSGAVRRFQADNSLRPTGVVDRRTAQALAGSMRRAKTTWYGPGFYGNRTACGQTLTYGTVGVAHRRLPCGTKVTFRLGGRSLVTEVIDRGPFVRGIMWDLTGAAARSLGFSGSGPIRYLVAG